MTRVRHSSADTNTTKHTCTREGCEGEYNVPARAPARAHIVPGTVPSGQCSDVRRRRGSKARVKQVIARVQCVVVHRIVQYRHMRVSSSDPECTVAGMWYSSRGHTSYTSRRTVRGGPRPGEFCLRRVLSQAKADPTFYKCNIGGNHRVIVRYIKPSGSKIKLLCYLQLPFMVAERG